MTARDGLVRMDVDTGWAYNRKVRKLQQLYPEQWPAYWCAYMALLAECWQRGRDGRRLTVMDAWCPALRVDPAEAQAALAAAGVCDKAGRVPAASWREWVEPVLVRVEAMRTGGAKGAANRWGAGNANGHPNGGANAPARQPARQPARPARARAHARVDSDPVDAASIMRTLGAGWLVDKEEDSADGIN